MGTAILKKIIIRLGNAVRNRECKLTVAQGRSHDLAPEHSPNGRERQAMWSFDKGQSKQAGDEQIQMFQGRMWSMQGVASVQMGWATRTRCLILLLIL